MIYNPQKIRALKPKAKRYSLALGDGLTLRVHPTGRKVFLVRIYTDGTIRDVTLGEFGPISLSQARKLARAHLELNALTPKRTHTVGDAFKLWCNHKKGRIKSFTLEKNRLDTYIIQRIKNHPLSDIKAPMFKRLLDEIAKTGKIATVRRVLIYSKEMFDLATFAGMIDSNPIQNLIKLYPAREAKAMPSVHHSRLSECFSQCICLSPRDKLLLLWSCLTLLRPKEAVSVKTTWINCDVLEMPADVMKNGLSHRVPLFGAHHEIMRLARKHSCRPRSTYVFAGRTTHISPQTLAKSLASTELSGVLVAHGLRSIGRTWLADHGAPYDIGEMCLAHNVHSQTARAYLRSDLLESRTPFMNDWTKYVMACADCAGLLDEFPTLARLAKELH